jgi:pimeloyl-ACP methyl ester carboxylesterase
MKLQPPSERQVGQLAKMVGEHPLPTEIARLILATERLPHFEHAFLSMLHRLLRLQGNRAEFALTSEQLARIAVPTLLVFARRDPMGAPPVGRRMAAAMTAAQLRVVDGGHAPWLQHADQIGPVINAFLDEIDNRAG